MNDALIVRRRAFDRLLQSGGRRPSSSRALRGEINTFTRLIKSNAADSALVKPSLKRMMTIAESPTSDSCGGK
jgi:hypothetical protein